MKSKRTNKTLALVILIGLWIPLLVNHLPGIKRLTVFGVEEPRIQKPTSWWDGSAQQDFASKLIDTSVSRTYLLRVRNQYQYSLFGKINAESVYQFGDQFFRFYMYGFNEKYNYVGLDTIRKKVDLLEQVQHKIGKDVPIITVIAPSKARYYEHLLPERHRTKTKRTNYDAYLNELAACNFTVLDFNDYFIKHPSETPAIFGNGGIHWSHYAAAIAMDSLIQYVSHVKNIPFSTFRYEPYYADGYNVDDLDIALMRNIFVRAKDDKLRNVKLFDVPRKRKLRAVIIGDSFFMTIQYMDLRRRIFSNDSPYYYYFGHECGVNYEEYPIDPKQVAAELKRADCVIIMSDIVNLENYTFGFPQKVLPYLD